MAKETRFDDQLAARIAAQLKGAAAEGASDNLEVLRFLPGLYHVVWRMAFDLTLPPGVRHYAASLAFYVFSGVDYVPDDTPLARGYIDDTVVVSLGLTRLIGRLGEETVNAHWRESTPLSEVLHRASHLASALPERIREKVQEYVEW